MVGICWVAVVGLSSSFSSSFGDDLLRQLAAAEQPWLVSVSTKGGGLCREHDYNQTVFGHNNQL